MKKYIWVLFLIVFMLAACGDKETASSSENSISAVTAAVQTTARTTAQTTAVTTSTKAVKTAPTPDINSETAFEYDCAENNLKPPRRNYWLRNFGKKLSAGNTPDGEHERFTEMYYGITAYVDGTSVYYKAYNNFGCECKALRLSLISDNDSEEHEINYEYQSIDMADAENGLYMLSAEFDNNTNLSVGIYMNCGDVWLCSVEDMSSDKMKYHIERRKKIAQLLDDYDVTPESSLYAHEFCYPIYENSARNYKCDVKEWSELSYSLVSPEWSDEKKVLAFHEWIVENMSYDHYCSDFQQYRYNYYEDYSGPYNAYSTHTGVCYDFTVIMTIMCRANGIPANTIDSKNHTWVLVWLNDRWVEIDLTADVYKSVYTENPNETAADERDHYMGYMSNKTDYFTRTPKVKYINDAWQIFFEPCEEK